MSYAIRNDGQGWRAVNTPDDVESDEYFSEVAPLPPGNKGAELSIKAQIALTKTDSVALRCYKAGVAFPKEWVDYTKAVRSILQTANSNPDQTLPDTPEYPSET